MKDCWPSRYGASRGSPNTGPVPGLAEVQFHRGAESQAARCPRNTPPLPDRPCRSSCPARCWANCGGGSATRPSSGKKRTSRTNRQPITGSSPGPIGARQGTGRSAPASPPRWRPVRLTEELPGLGDPQPRRVAEKATADQPVMRVVSLEEERLARGQDPELAGTAGLPEIDLRHPRPVRQEPVPVVVGHPHIRPHNRYCARPADLRSGNPAIAPQPATVDAQREARGRRR